MCSPKQPSPPTNPAGYAVEDSWKQVKKEGAAAAPKTSVPSILPDEVAAQRGPKSWNRTDPSNMRM